MAGYSEGTVLRRLTARFVLSLQFLTIIPIPLGPERFPALGDQDNLAGSYAFFPLAGLVIGGMLAALWYGLHFFLPANLVAALIVTAEALLTGALHLDGVSDTVDALAARKPLAAKLEIMKSGAAGPMGCAAVVCTLLMKFTALEAILLSFPCPGLTLTLFPLLGRWAAAAAIHHGRSARPDGLGRTFIDKVRRGSFVFATLTAAGLSVLFGMFCSSPSGGLIFFNKVQYLLVLVMLYPFTLMAVRFFTSHFGGLTGDNIGAVIEFSELTVLLALLLTAPAAQAIGL